MTFLNVQFSTYRRIFEIVRLGLSWGSVVKNPSAYARDMASIPGLGRSPGEGNGHPLQYSYLENPMYRGALWITVHGVTPSRR